MTAWETGPRTPQPPGPLDAEADAQDRPINATLFADYFDGRRALRQRVELASEDGARGRVLILRRPSGEEVRWPVRRIRRLPDQAGRGVVTFGLSSGEAGRLVVEDREARRMIMALDPRAGEWLQGPSLWRRALVVAGGGAVSLLLLFFVVLPGLAGLLAKFMDPEAEAAMGQIHYEQTRILFSGGEGALPECRDPAGMAALRDLTERVAGDIDLPYELYVAVLDDRANPILNAYAVAGGRITFFNSMIQAAESPEEIAAVLAHELGHVVNDDPVRHTLQAASGMAVLSLLLGDITGGGVLGGTAGSALTANYSRQAEVAADAFAYDQLTAAGLPPSALGRMFERLRDEYGDTEGLVAHFSSHPQLADRISRAADAGDPVTGAPALQPRAWADLRGICG